MMRLKAWPRFSHMGVRIVLVVLCLLVAAFASGCRDERADASMKLISAFQSGCVTHGRWSDAALSHTNSLISVIQDLKNTDACKPFAATLGSIKSLGEQLGALISSTEYAEYRQAEETLSELTLALGSAPQGSELASQLSTALVETQIDLARKRAAANASESTHSRDRYAKSTAQLAGLMQTMIASTDGLGACLQQNPAAAVQIATNLVAIGGSYVSPVLGAGLGVMGQLVNYGVEQARSQANNDALWKLYSAQMPLALTCGLESMTELYCNANDAFDLLQLQADQYPRPGQPGSPLWRGIDILGRRLPVLNSWLSFVRNGVRPTDPLDAERQNAVWRKLQRLEEYYRNVYASLNYTKRLYDGAQGEKAKQDDLLVRFIKHSSHDLVAGGNIYSNPFRDKSTDEDFFSCWLVLGVSAICPERDVVNGETGERYIRNKLLSHASMQGLFDNWDGLYTAVKGNVDLEFRQTITTDPTPLLAAARESTVDNISPRAVLMLINEFLDAMNATDDGSNPQLGELIADTRKLIASALATLDSGSPELKPINRIQALFETFKLAQGLQFFNERVSSLVQWDITRRLKRGEFPRDATEILRAAGVDLKARLMASGVRDLNLISQDINRARMITERNLETFRTFFEPSLGRAVVELSRAAEKAGEPVRGPNRPNGQLLAQLCTLVLASADQWPRKVSWDVCQNTVLDSIYADPDGKLSLEVARLRAELDGKPYRERMCVFHRFLRAGRLAEALAPKAQNYEPELVEWVVEPY